MTDRALYMTNIALDKLPMFASDLDLGVAIAGKAGAVHWKRHVLPILEAKQGFPRYDSLHGGRPVPLVRRFYETYLGLTGDYVSKGADDGKDEFWIGKRITNRIDKEERMRANGENVVERDFGVKYPPTLKAIAEYRAKKAAEHAAARDRRRPPT